MFPRSKKFEMMYKEDRVRRTLAVLEKLLIPLFQRAGYGTATLTPTPPPLLFPTIVILHTTTTLINFQVPIRILVLREPPLPLTAELAVARPHLQRRFGSGI
jgi:hypothetical protein